MSFRCLSIKYTSCSPTPVRVTTSESITFKPLNPHTVHTDFIARPIPAAEHYIKHIRRRHRLEEATGRVPQSGLSKAARSSDTSPDIHVRIFDADAAVVVGSGLEPVECDDGVVLPDASVQRLGKSQAAFPH